jgi:Mg2+ and Co2+ transporter CorA
MPPPRDWESKVFDKLTELDNGNTIILFESSHTGNSSDTMIQAREEIEVRWRRLMLYLNKEEQSEEKLAMELMDLVLRDVFNGLRVRWEKTLSKCEAHVNILEDKVYENPADESRAPELWSNSAMWLKLEQLITLHTVTVKDLQQQMRDLSDCEEFIKDDWVRDTPADLERIADQFDQEMVKPTANLSDLLYKSVEIRDSRHSLQLGLSMWRLSWITFIFLPLTFMGTIFGMNVDIFQPADGNFPGLKWYFIISIPFMILIIIVYIFIKSSLSASVSHDIPLQRGVYEQIYNQFAEAHPHLWSELGPKSYVKPRTWVGRLQWRLVKRWFKPERTIARRGYTEIDEMGLWARIKHSLASRWLRQLKLAAGSGPSDEEYGSGPDGDGEFSTVTELLQVSMPVEMGVGSAAVAGAAPRSPPMMRHLLPHRSRRSSSESQPIGGRNASPGSEMMVEEEKSDDEASGVSKEKLAERKKRAAEKEKQAVTGAETGLGLQRGESEPGLLSGNFLALPFGRKSDDRVEKS